MSISAKEAYEQTRQHKPNIKHFINKIDDRIQAATHLGKLSAALFTSPMSTYVEEEKAIIEYYVDLGYCVNIKLNSISWQQYHLSEEKGSI